MQRIVKRTLAVGLGLGRRPRLGPDSLLLVYLAAMLMQANLDPGGVDRLPAAPALAFLIGDGSLIVLTLLLGRFTGARGPAS